MLNFMEEAIKQANKALEKDEVPIGAVIVKNGKIIARGYNCREKNQNALMHAEIVAIDKACKKLNSWRLDGCQIYVTLEPCPMCAGAIVNARIDKLVYGCQEKTSEENLCEKILKSNRLYHHTEIVFHQTYQKQISQILSAFFQATGNRH